MTKDQLQMDLPLSGNWLVIKCLRDLLAVMAAAETSLKPFLFEVDGMEFGLENFMVSRAVFEGIDADIRAPLVYAE